VALKTAEGGFAVGFAGESRIPKPEKGRVLARGSGGYSAARDIPLSTHRVSIDDVARGRTTSTRIGRVICTEPDTNVMAPRAMVPLLVGDYPPGEHWLLAAFYGEAAGLEDAPVEETPSDWTVPCLALLHEGELHLHIGDEARRFGVDPQR
jgi:hypothetical protein